MSDESNLAIRLKTVGYYCASYIHVAPWFGEDEHSMKYVMRYNKREADNMLKRLQLKHPEDAGNFEVVKLRK